MKDDRGERTGWVLFAVGVGVCLAAWCAFAFALYLYGTAIGRQVF